ncbi:MAG: acyltransferase family protein [Lachnospiraceae bacterium]|nr:acyltransferase family protein [Lachnospiraceae bacterium]
MSEEQFRNKIIWFSFAFSLLVVWVHSYNAELYLGLTIEMAQIYRAEHRIGDWIGQIAVPGFFMISAYLFYRDFTWKKLKGKWTRRINSVLVPFILWNTIYYLGYVIGSRLPWVADVVGKGIIPFTLPALVDAIMHYTYNYVFWYLFQLILLILLAPVLYPVLKCVWSRIVFLAALWGLAICGLRLPLVNVDALIYYATAASFALAGQKERARRPVEAAGSPSRAAVGLSLIVLAACAYCMGLRRAFAPCFILCRLFAVAGLWLIVPGQRLPQAKEFMRYNFFLYATHFAFVRFINKAGAMLFAATWQGTFLIYLLMPFLVLGISTVLGRVLRKCCPSIWNIINGRR